MKPRLSASVFAFFGGITLALAFMLHEVWLLLGVAGAALLTVAFIIEYSPACPVCGGTRYTYRIDSATDTAYKRCIRCGTYSDGL